MYTKRVCLRKLQNCLINGKTYLVINDYERLRQLFGNLLSEVQRIKSEGDYEAGKDLVEEYAIKINPELHKEVIERYKKLDIAPYRGLLTLYMY